MDKSLENQFNLPVSDLDYHLPDHLIAQSPLEKRDNSRLLVCNRKTGTIEHHHFSDLPSLLPPRTLLVINTSKVFPARIEGLKETGGNVELLFLREIEPGKWRVIFSRRARMPEGRRIFLFDGKITATLIERIGDGKDILEMDNPSRFKDLMSEFGQTPLPPYIADHDVEPDRYQTVYANKSGSAAAPTAGLHFTEELIEQMIESGFSFAPVELQIGLDTFSPIRADNLNSHSIHSEYGIVLEKTAKLIEEAKADRRSVLTVGTTSTRLVEYVAMQKGKVVSFDGDVDLFIVPGHRFRVSKHLLTNFHLPKTTLLALVGAFMGMDFMFKAYREAIDNNYRFYSFGDSMLIL